jgi:hypothetical protein
MVDHKSESGLLVLLMKKKEEDYEDNKKCKWWIFYESNKVNKKSEFKTTN